MSNFYQEWKDLFGPGPLMVGQVTAYDGGVATIQLPGGGTLRARGEADVGTNVYLRDGVIQGPAPSLPIDSAEL